MKVLFLIGLLLCGQSAFAATRCVPDLTKINCTEIWPETNFPDAESRCTNGLITVDAVMLGVCASDEFNYSGQVADTIHISNTIIENTYCWCRMLKPTVSKWISIAGSSCNGEYATCAATSGLNGLGNPYFRNALMNNPF